MARAKKGAGKAAAKANGGNGANLGFEAQLWKAADALRSNMDAAEYKHVVLGLIFLKYISDAFEEKMARLTEQLREQMKESEKLDKVICAKLKDIGYED